MDERPTGEATAENREVQPAGCAEKHFYGGQAVIEGVMMRGTDRYAVAVRREDGEIVVGEKPIENYGDKHKWAKWPLIRGNVAMVDSLILGFAALQFSADVLRRRRTRKPQQRPGRKGRHLRKRTSLPQESAPC